MAKVLTTAQLQALDAQNDADFAAYQRQCRAEIATSTTCYKCNGKGRIRGFGHIDGGKCFACNGTGKRRPLRAA